MSFRNQHVVVREAPKSTARRDRLTEIERNVQAEWAAQKMFEVCLIVMFNSHMAHYQLEY